MRFVISTYFNDKNFNIPSQRLEIKTNELQKAFEICRAFVIGSKSCKICIWENKNKTKNPDYGALLSVCDIVEDNGILTNEIIFNNWILNFRENVKKFEKQFNNSLKGR
jgi:hypothetical protein